MCKTSDLKIQWKGCKCIREGEGRRRGEWRQEEEGKGGGERKEGGSTGGKEGNGGWGRRKRGGGVFLRCSICRSIPEIFAIKVESCQKWRWILDVFFTLPNFRGPAFQKLYQCNDPCLNDWEKVQQKLVELVWASRLAGLASTLAVLY